jgi:hypothetical protein
METPPNFGGRFDVRMVTFDVPIRPPFAPSPEGCTVATVVPMLIVRGLAASGTS